MGKNHVLNKGKIVITKTSTLEERIFDELRDKLNHTPGKTITQTALAEKIGTTQSTISRHLRKLIGREYDNSRYYYKIVFVNPGYKMIRQDKPRCCDPKRPTPIEHRVQEAEIRRNGAEEIKDSDCLIDMGVVEVNNYVILYKLKKNKADLVINTLRSGFPEHYFYDILSNENGIYIILDDKKLGIDINNARSNICEYYKDMLRELKSRPKTSRG